jgi:hypothetical protein
MFVREIQIDDGPHKGVHLAGSLGDVEHALSWLEGETSGTRLESASWRFTGRS